VSIYKLEVLFQKLNQMSGQEWQGENKKCYKKEVTATVRSAEFN